MSRTLTPSPMSVKIMRSEGLTRGIIISMCKCDSVLKPFSLCLLPASVQEPRKLSYAEVCQRPPKDPLPAAPVPTSTGTASGQPLRELRVNKAEEPCASSGSGDKQEKGHDREGGWECKESRPTRERDSQGYYRSNGPRGTGGLKFRDQRRPPPAQRSAPQGGYRHTGKEQNIPPVSPK